MSSGTKDPASRKKDPASEPCQEWLKIEETLPEPRSTDDVTLLRQDFRDVLDNIRKVAHNPHKIIPNGSKTVTARDGRKIPIRIYSPPGHPYTSSSTPSSPALTSPPALTPVASAPAKLSAANSNNDKLPPLVIYFHGGGWCTGDPDFGLNECYHFAGNGALVVAADYRKAPENNFPVPVNDCYDAYKAILDPNSPLNLRFDRDRIYLAGASAGGHLCLTTVILDIMDAEKESGGHGGTTKVKGLLLHAPVTCHPRAFKENGEYPDSYIDHAGSPILGRISMDRFWRLFTYGEQMAHGENSSPTTSKVYKLKSEMDLKQPLLSPLYCPETILKRFPKTHIGVYGMDPLKDEGRELAERMKKCGVEVQLDTYKGWPHCAFMFFPQTEGAREGFAGIEKAAKWMGLFE